MKIPTQLCLTITFSPPLSVLNLLLWAVCSLSNMGYCYSKFLFIQNIFKGCSVKDNLIGRLTETNNTATSIYFRRSPVLKLQDRAWQTFRVKGQRLNTFILLGYRDSVAAAQLCLHNVKAATDKMKKKKKDIFK